MNVEIKGISKTVKGLEDSAARISVIRFAVIAGLNAERVGSVKLRDIFGSPIQADLIRLHFK